MTARRHHDSAEEAMFEILVESRATHARDVVGMAMSMLTHAALVCGAVGLTARATTATVAEGARMPPVVTWVAPRRDLSRRYERSTTWPPSQMSRRAPLPRSIHIDVDLPEQPGLPPVGFGSLGADPARASDWCLRPSDCTVTPAATRESAPFSDSPFYTERMANLIGTAPRPRYPDMLREAGLNGRVLVQFTVDTAGRIEPASTRVLQATHDEFARAVLDVLPRYRFVPAEVNGRRVRVVAQMPFEFSLTSR